jgi:secreted PhoX family phosphatase
MNDMRHPAGCVDPDDIGHNDGGNPTFQSILETSLSRRTLLKSGVGLAASSFFGLGLTGCGSNSSSDGTAAGTAAAHSLSFTAVAKSVADALSVPSGYTATPLYRLGDPIDAATAAYANDGTDASFNTRAGDHHDGMQYFGLNSAGTAWDASSSDRGLLCINHENMTQIFLHTAAQVAAYNVASRVAAEIDKEVSAHGVSVVEIKKTAGVFQVDKASAFNRRITAATPCDLAGPAAGHALMKTNYSIDGTRTRGTLNNCANGYTPWGTYLTCEENWAGYFKRVASADNPLRPAKEVTALTRYGVASSNGGYGWANSTTAADIYARWNAGVTGASADGSDDYRYVANTFGWTMEIDPFDPSSAPRKRTALGRFNHEGAWPAKVTAGKPIVIYMGDDARNEYIYKFVSTANWDAADATRGLAAGNKYLDSGKLFVAKFSADGSGQWIELNIANPLISGYATYAFADQADVLINCRLAADAVGATKMDRPEWGAVNPVNGEVYMTLTNNSQRAAAASNPALDAANPRYYTDSANKGNVNGHIIRWRETGSDPAATSFAWDVYLFGAQAAVDAGGDDAYYQANVNLSALAADNDFSSPDGVWFSQKTPGLLWIETDDGAYTDITNCMLLAGLPGQVGDGSSKGVLSKSVPQAGNADVTTTTYVGKAPGTSGLRRFLVGPKGCEITGVAETPDGKALFVNIQHPGENSSAANIGTPANYESHWPDGGTARPRSGTIVITRNDGGVIGV